MLAAGVAAFGMAASARAADGVHVDVLSNRADLISGGDALVAIDVPDGVDPAAVRVSVDGRDVTSAFAQRPDGRFEGLVEGLALGRNVVRATAPGGRRAHAVVIDHRNGGPVFSGPQVMPWVCQNGSSDPQCEKPAGYAYQYKSSVTGQFAAYDPSAPPADLASTTTDQGRTVPYVVRVETGYQDRDEYRIAVLYDPAKPWAPWAPQDGWNHKLLITHGASCGIDHQSGSAPDVLDDAALSRGFAVMSTALDNAGHDCNIVTEAESMVMAKERLVERYGPIRYTIGTGCSGGSLTQQQVANAYPGIYQGILPQCSFPDAWSTGQQLVDYDLLRRYLEHPDRWGTGVAWTPLQIAAVEGHPNHVNAVILDSLYWTALGDPTSGCAGVTAEQSYDPATNPGGVRCTLMDYAINVLAPRRPEVWGPQEKALGRGFGGIPLDNVGVQYGLEALRRGLITTEQFVDLNERVGGGDIDVNPTAARFEANQPALRNSYRSGGVNEANNLDRVAIIDLRGPDPGAFHDAYRTWAVRARLEREHGTFANHVIWFGHVPLIGDPSYTTDGLVAMDRWLAAVEADGRPLPLAAKIRDDRPGDLQDRCSQVPGVEQVDVPGVGRVCELEQVQTRFGTPRTVAGEGVETDIQKCRLVSLRREAYYPATFTDAQWARLRTAFPEGVCDFSRLGVSQQGAVPWQTYQRDAAGADVVYGGRALGAAPAGSGNGWTSPAFASWRTAERG